jgi:CelD/BcsL family acetyltransferase involved in cellulose biosynthesis
MVLAAQVRQPAGTEYQIETLRDYESFLRLEPKWNELLERSRLPYPFLTHEWVRTWVECFGGGRRIFVLVVKARSEVVAIVPLMVRPGWMYGLPVTRLQSIHNVYSERFDFIVEGPSEEIYRAIWRHLIERGPRWHVLELRQVPASSPTLGHLSEMAAADRYPTERWHSSDSPYVEMNGSFESYFSTLDRKHRSNLRNRLGRLSRLGDVELEMIDGEDRVAAALAEGWALEAAGWKGKAGTAIECLPRVRAFYDAFATRAARRGWLRLYFLKVGGRRIAFSYFLCFSNRMFLLKPGYDPVYAPFSPSTVLCSMVLRESFERGIQEFDFLGINDGWKQRWSHTTRPHEWLFIFRPGPRSQVLRWAKFRVAPWLRKARGVA